MMSETEDDFPVPPASFEFLVASLVMQAQASLGLLHFGKEEERPKANLSLARHAIDMLAMLQDKTRGNLTMEEQRELENSLTELRFRFVQRAAGREARGRGEPGAAAQSS
jgi:hypothetical protein